MTHEPIDQSTLQKLLNAIGGDQEDLHELIDDFFDEGPQLVEQMRSAAIPQDINSLRIAAHSLKSNAREFGAHTLEELCRVLEQQCRDESVQNAEQHISAINDALGHALNSLEKIRHGRG